MTPNALHTELTKIVAEAAFPIAARTARTVLLGLADAMATSARDTITSAELRAEADRYDLTAPESPAALERPVAAAPRRRGKALNIYVIERDDNTVKYDETAGVVVIAANADDARQFAMGSRGGQDSGVWYARGTTVTHVGQALPDAVGGVLLTDFNAG